jgi:hypothetical protein
MNNIEEQTMNDDTNPRIIQVTWMPERVPPQRKKVYSKPTLLVLQTLNSHGKSLPYSIEDPVNSNPNVGPS